MEGIGKGRGDWRSRLKTAGAAVIQCCGAAVGKGKEVGLGRQNVKVQMEYWKNGMMEST